MTMQPTPTEPAALQDHTISMTTAYGDVLASEEVAEDDFPAALRRFHDRAVERVSSVVVVDGVAHSRNAFLEFVREFNACASRSRRVPS